MNSIVQRFHKRYTIIISNENGLDGAENANVSTHFSATDKTALNRNYYILRTARQESPVRSIIKEAVLTARRTAYILRTARVDPSSAAGDTNPIFTPCIVPCATIRLISANRLRSIARVQIGIRMRRVLSSGDRAFGSGPKGRRFDSCRTQPMLTG